MAKILVADDNSNIQKMVGLALKDQGIDVVAVGNGEAAVRKISDIKPDLVLADVFMPVRNGYEVCQYVKTDPSLAHIPVILLVGAFDPLDEQEAQRVGADGVLKKPFVPPDPLISMVKSALARAGVSLTGAPPEAAQKPLAALDLLKGPPSSPHPLPSIEPIPMPSSISLPAIENDPEPEEFSTRPAPVRIDAGKGPLAFSSLLGNVTPSEKEEDPGAIPTVHPELATERDWRSAEEDETEEEAETVPKASWRRDGADEVDAADPAESAVHDWRATGTGGKHHAPWTPTVEKTKIPDPEEMVESISAKSTETIVAERNRSVTAAPFSGDAWTAAVSAGAEETTAVATNTAPVEVPVAVPAYVAEAAPANASPEQRSEAHVPVLVPSMDEPGQTEAAGASLTNSWFSSSSSPWEAEAEKASRLASTWDTPVSAVAVMTAPEAAPVVEEPAPEPEIAAAVPEAVASPDAEILTGSAAVAIEQLNGNHGTSAYVAESIVEEHAVHAPVAVEVAEQHISLPAETVEAIREEAAHVAEAVQQPAPAAFTEEAAPSAPQPNMDDLVAKVLARMSPETMQAMTRELLKPVVEAMVREELNAKK